jgi:hypothetical protein
LTPKVSKMNREMGQVSLRSNFLFHSGTTWLPRTNF